MEIDNFEEEKNLDLILSEIKLEKTFKKNISEQFNEIIYIYIVIIKILIKNLLKMKYIILKIM